MTGSIVNFVFSFDGQTAIGNQNLELNHVHIRSMKPTDQVVCHNLSKINN